MISHFSPYDHVADEYYDSTLHPTCANFRELGVKFINRLASTEVFEHLDEDVTFVETGAGKSTVLEALPDLHGFHAQLILQDDSERMLRHSLKWQNSVKDLLVCDARRMPFGDRAIQGTFSFLADPYNDEQLWNEVARITAPGGFWLTTLPSHTWAKRFRSKMNQKKSRFLTRSGDHVDLPSHTYPPSRVIGALERNGFTLIRFDSMTLEDLSGPISSKLEGRERDTSVVDCYLFKKQLP